MTGINCEGKDEVKIYMTPTEYAPICPCCKSSEIIRNGKDGYRNVRHLPIARKKCILILPRIRMKCKVCGCTYAHEYSFVSGKQRYTKEYKAHVYEQSIGSTVQHAAKITKTPYSTVERFFKEMVMRLAPVTEGYAQKQARESTRLILGIDDFAIRKGHNYNTGIHDLRGESLLCVIKGRTLPIVMDLAKAYHIFSAEFFPGALRVADRFHVNGYIIEALNDIRRRVGKGLPTQARLNLNRNKHILNKRSDNLDGFQQKQLKTLLAYSDDLKAVYDLKERLIDWYDCSSSYQAAQVGLKRWLDKGHSFNIPEINRALKTFDNWQNEILNYHRCRFTNGIVEGRNGKIKALQRRRFFVHNRTFYEALIMLECNQDIAYDQFMAFTSSSQPRILI